MKQKLPLWIYMQRSGRKDKTVKSGVLQTSSGGKKCFLCAAQAGLLLLLEQQKHNSCGAIKSLPEIRAPSDDAVGAVVVLDDLTVTWKIS